MQSPYKWCSTQQLLSCEISGRHLLDFKIWVGGFVQEFRLENRSYPDVHDFSLRMQLIIAND